MTTSKRLWDARFSKDLTSEGIPESSMEVKGKTLSSCLRTVLTLAAYCQEQRKGWSLLDNSDQMFAFAPKTNIN